MSELHARPAPRWRAALAGAIDAAIAAGTIWGLRGRAPDARPMRIAAALIAPGGELVREQLGSPGQRLLGLRTVDRRTGRRVELWRTLVVLGAAASGQMLARRVRGTQDPELERRREAFARELGEISRRHAADPAARDAAVRRHVSENHPPALRGRVLRGLAPTLLFGLLNRRVRRRLAPTREVRVARGGPHRL